jgi:hypothetical protein
MFYRDYAPPHFHAEYGEYEITVEIETGNMKRQVSAARSWRGARME